MRCGPYTYIYIYRERERGRDVKASVGGLISAKLTHSLRIASNRPLLWALALRLRRPATEEKWPEIQKIGKHIGKILENCRKIGEKYAENSKFLFFAQLSSYYLVSGFFLFCSWSTQSQHLRCCQLYPKPPVIRYVTPPNPKPKKCRRIPKREETGRDESQSVPSPEKTLFKNKGFGAPNFSGISPKLFAALHGIRPYLCTPVLPRGQNLKDSGFGFRWIAGFGIGGFGGEGRGRGRKGGGGGGRVNGEGEGSRWESGTVKRGGGEGEAIAVFSANLSRQYKMRCSRWEDWP